MSIPMEEPSKLSPISAQELNSLAFFMGEKAFHDRRLGLAWDIFDDAQAREDFDLGYSYAEWKTVLFWVKPK